MVIKVITECKLFPVERNFKNLIQKFRVGYFFITTKYWREKEIKIIKIFEIFDAVMQFN